MYKIEEVRERQRKARNTLKLRYANPSRRLLSWYIKDTTAFLERVRELEEENKRLQDEIDMVLEDNRTSEVQ